MLRFRSLALAAASRSGVGIALHEPADASGSRGSATGGTARAIRTGVSARVACVASAAGAVCAWAGARQTWDGGEAACGGGATGAGGGAGEVLAHVGAGAEEGLEHCLVVGYCDGGLDTFAVRVDVGSLSGDVRARGSVVALHVDVFEDRVVVAVLLNVRGVPVDQSSRPGHCALAILGDTGRPQGELNTGRGLRVVVLIVCFVEGVALLQRADVIAIDRPRELIGLPINGVSVECAEGIAAVGHGDGFLIVVCISQSMMMTTRIRNDSQFVTPCQ